MNWIKQSGAPGKNYPAGFTNQVTASGSTFTKASKGGGVINGSALTVAFIGGELDAPITNAVTIAGSKVSNEGVNKMTMNISPTTGKFAGKSFRRFLRQVVTVQWCHPAETECRLWTIGRPAANEQGDPRTVRLVTTADLKQIWGVRYELAISEKALQQLRALPKPLRQQLGWRIDELQDGLKGDVLKLQAKGNITGCE